MKKLFLLIFVAILAIGCEKEITSKEVRYVVTVHYGRVIADCSGVVDTLDMGIHAYSEVINIGELAKCYVKPDRTIDGHTAFKLEVYSDNIMIGLIENGYSNRNLYSEIEFEQIIK